MEIKRVKKIIYVLLVVLALVINCFSFGANTVRAKAENTKEDVANMVIFVKFSDDDRDIYNATYNSSYSRENWQLIKKMYDCNTTYDYVENKEYDNSFKNYIKTTILI